MYKLFILLIILILLILFLYYNKTQFTEYFDYNEQLSKGATPYEENISGENYRFFLEHKKDNDGTKYCQYTLANNMNKAHQFDSKREQKDFHSHALNKELITKTGNDISPHNLDTGWDLGDFKQDDYHLPEASAHKAYSMKITFKIMFEPDPTTTPRKANNFIISLNIDFNDYDIRAAQGPDKLKYYVKEYIKNKKSCFHDANLIKKDGGQGWELTKHNPNHFNLYQNEVLSSDFNNLTKINMNVEISYNTLRLAQLAFGREALRSGFEIQHNIKFTTVHNGDDDNTLFKYIKDNMSTTFGSVDSSRIKLLRVYENITDGKIRLGESVSTSASTATDSNRETKTSKWAWYKDYIWSLHLAPEAFTTLGKAPTQSKPGNEHFSILNYKKIKLSLGFSKPNKYQIATELGNLWNKLIDKEDDMWIDFGDNINMYHYKMNFSDDNYKKFMLKIYIIHYRFDTTNLGWYEGTTNKLHTHSEPSENHLKPNKYISDEMIEDLEYENLKIFNKTGDSFMLKFEDGNIPHSVFLTSNNITGWGDMYNSNQKDWKECADNIHDSEPMLRASTTKVGSGQMSPFWTTYNYTNFPIENSGEFKKKIISLIPFKDLDDLKKMVTLSKTWSADTKTKYVECDWNVTNLTDFTELFKDYNVGVNNIGVKNPINTDEWDTSLVTNMSSMFENSKGHKGGRGLTPTKLNTNEVTNMSKMYKNAISNGSTYDWDELDVSKVTNFSEMFYSDIESVTSFKQNNTGILPQPANNLDKWVLNKNASANIDMTKMFAGTSSGIKGVGGCINLERKGEFWNTTRVTNMAGMFKFSNLAVLMGLNTWNVENVTNMKEMFRNFYQSITINFSNWVVSSVTTMEGMFANTKLIIKGIENWDVTKVTNITDMFEGLTDNNFVDANGLNKKPDLSNWIDKWHTGDWPDPNSNNRVKYLLDNGFICPQRAEDKKCALLDANGRQWMRDYCSTQCVGKDLHPSCVSWATSNQCWEEVSGGDGGLVKAECPISCDGIPEPTTTPIPTTTSLPPTTTSLPPTTTSLPPTTTSLPPTTTSLPPTTTSLPPTTTSLAPTTTTLGPAHWKKILFQRNNSGEGGIKLDNMDEDKNYFIIKHFKNEGTYLSYIKEGDVVEYKKLNKGPIDSEFKFKIDTFTEATPDNEFWNNYDAKQTGDYIIYPEDNPNVYLTLWENYLTIQPQIAQNDNNKTKQIFSDN
jgi:hypothetical protein